MGLMRRQGLLQQFFKGWVYQSQSSSNCPHQPPPPLPNGGSHTWDGEYTLGIGIG